MVKRTLLFLTWLTKGKSGATLAKFLIWVSDLEMIKSGAATNLLSKGMLIMTAYIFFPRFPVRISRVIVYKGLPPTSVRYNCMFCAFLISHELHGRFVETQLQYLDNLSLNR